MIDTVKDRTGPDRPSVGRSLLNARRLLGRSRSLPAVANGWYYGGAGPLRRRNQCCGAAKLCCAAAHTPTTPMKTHRASRRIDLIRDPALTDARPGSKYTPPQKQRRNLRRRLCRSDDDDDDGGRRARPERDMSRVTSCTSPLGRDTGQLQYSRPVTVTAALKAGAGVASMDELTNSE